jgi:hypothetical protein
MLEISRLTGDFHQHIALREDADQRSVADDQDGATVTLAHQLEYLDQRGRCVDQKRRMAGGVCDALVRQNRFEIWGTGALLLRHS